MRNVYILPAPEIFRQKFEALRERFRGEPFHLRNVFVSMSEGTLADFLNKTSPEYPDRCRLLPEFSNPAYKVKVTLESRDPEYVSRALETFLRGCPTRPWSAWNSVGASVGFLSPHPGFPPTIGSRACEVTKRRWGRRWSW